MKSNEWTLIKAYIDAKIDYEIARREEDEEGYRGNAYDESKAFDKAEEEIEKYLKR